MAILAIVVLFLLIQVFGSYDHLEEMTFSEIESYPGELVVVFYHSSGVTSDDALSVVDEVSKSFKDHMPSSKLRFLSCDGDLAVNKGNFEAAQFNEDSYVFTQTTDGGIQKYAHDLDAKTLFRHLKYSITSPKENKVVPFTTQNELLERSQTRPQFIKFYQEWCTHCKAAKKPFTHAASLLHESVDFVDVHCSGNDEEKAFCQATQVSGYPLIKLLHGDENVKYEGTRTVLGFEKFLNEYVKNQLGEKDEL